MPLTIQKAAESMGVSVRSVKRALFIRSNAIPEIIDLCEQGQLTLGPTEQFVRHAGPKEQLAVAQYSNPAAMIKILLADFKRGHVAPNPITKAWNKATDAQRDEFLESVTGLERTA